MLKKIYKILKFKFSTFQSFSKHFHKVCLEEAELEGVLVPNRHVQYRYFFSTATNFKEAYEIL